MTHIPGLFAVYSTLAELWQKLMEQPRRDYNQSSDWPGGSTGGQSHACVYIIWGDSFERALYVGETKDLGRRTGNLFNLEPKKWTQPPRFVQYLSCPELDDLNLRKLFERLAICLLAPSDNAG